MAYRCVFGGNPVPVSLVFPCHKGNRHPSNRKQCRTSIFQQQLWRHMSWQPAPGTRAGILPRQYKPSHTVVAHQLTVLLNDKLHSSCRHFRSATTTEDHQYTIVAVYYRSRIHLLFPVGTDLANDTFDPHLLMLFRRLGIRTHRKAFPFSITSKVFRFFW